MTSTLYILDEQGCPKPEPDALAWAYWFEGRHKIVAQTDIGPVAQASAGAASVKVSTVFLGLDHNFSLSGPPILWETMVFGGPKDQYCRRCSGSREQAEAMHAQVLAMLQNSSLRRSVV